MTVNVNISILPFGTAELKLSMPPIQFTQSQQERPLPIYTEPLYTNAFNYEFLFDPEPAPDYIVPATTFRS